jgi:predicted ATP-grasp superfamily ATP-dependent carboligase
MKVLILDGGNQNTLAAVRYLGRAGHQMHVVAPGKNSLAVFSKYCFRAHILPDPRTHAEVFTQQLLGLLREEKFDVLLPMGFRTYQLCARYADEIRKFTTLTITTQENIALASDKRLTYALAETLGVPYPKTFQVDSLDAVAAIETPFPVVIKSSFESGTNVVKYAHNKKELIEKFEAMVKKHGFKPPDFPIIQQYITGEGYGFFSYYENGVCKAFFMHHRLREYPPSGGVSVCAESFFDNTLMQQGKKLLDALAWDGVAMVEFKKHSDGEYKLMEINPKFWGSLELALCAGVNFPEMLLKRAARQPVNQDLPYRQVTFQWLINGELFHVIERPSALFKVLIQLLSSQTDFYWSDIKPHLFQIAYLFKHFWKKKNG